MPGTGFSHLATVTASTKRTASVGTSGKAGTAITNLTSIKVVPLSPVNDTVRFSPHLGQPHELWQTFVEGNPDVARGDTLVIGSALFPIVFVEDWSFKSDTRIRVIVQKPDTR